MNSLDTPLKPRGYWVSTRIWPSLRARGGFVVDIEWQDGTLKEAVVRSLNGRPATLRYNDVVRPLDLEAGESHVFDLRS